MSTKPKTTYYTASTVEAVEATWALKRVTDTHKMQQEALKKEFKARSEKLTEEAQVKQAAAFEALRIEIGIPDEIWGDGSDWSANLTDLAAGTVALIHDQDESANGPDCSCPVCELSRLLLESLSGNDCDDHEKATPFRVH